MPCRVDHVTNISKVPRISTHEYALHMSSSQRVVLIPQKPATSLLRVVAYMGPDPLMNNMTVWLPTSTSCRRMLNQVYLRSCHLSLEEASKFKALVNSDQVTKDNINMFNVGVNIAWHTLAAGNNLSVTEIGRAHV